MATVRTEITNEQWFNYLEKYGIIETEHEKLKRKRVIELLQRILVNFQELVAKDLDWKRGDIECFLSPFGSYALGGYLGYADIDLVLVCPYQVQRKFFFRTFPLLLKQQPMVKNIEVIEKANVPIIKCTIDNISIDMSFARLKLERISSTIDFLDDSLLQDIDETCVASMDGPRVNQFCKKQIRRQDTRLFQVSLQCIKHWATQRGIYNKPLGYLNGSSWTLLLTKTYMSIEKKEKLSVTTLLYTFFNLWSQWPWNTPVMLTKYIPGMNGTEIKYSSLTDFTNSVMPIVSPCYPVCNVAPYVTKSTKKVMQLEFERGKTLLQWNTSPFNIINKLFNPLDYLKRYKHFITFITSSSTMNSHDIWTRKMATYVPKYLELIESVPDILYAQPLASPYQSITNYQTTEGKLSLQNGTTQEEAQADDNYGMLNPGVLYLTYYTIGIMTEVGSNEIDLTAAGRSFLALLESKRNRRDEDVHWTIEHIDRKKAAALLHLNIE